MVLTCNFIIIVYRRVLGPHVTLIFFFYANPSRSRSGGKLTFSPTRVFIKHLNSIISIGKKIKQKPIRYTMGRPLFPTGQKMTSQKYKSFYFLSQLGTKNHQFNLFYRLKKKCMFYKCTSDEIRKE